jgi:hypothetical protein
MSTVWRQFCECILVHTYNDTVDVSPERRACHDSSEHYSFASQSEAVWLCQEDSTVAYINKKQKTIPYLYAVTMTLPVLHYQSLITVHSCMHSVADQVL